MYVCIHISSNCITFPSLKSNKKSPECSSLKTQQNENVCFRLLSCQFTQTIRDKNVNTVTHHTRSFLYANKVSYFNV